MRQPMETMREKVERIICSECLSNGISIADSMYVPFSRNDFESKVSVLVFNKFVLTYTPVTSSSDNYFWMRLVEDVDARAARNYINERRREFAQSIEVI
jgi:hypothetical protein